MVVLMIPGAYAFTVILCFASSSAGCSVSAASYVGTSKHAGASSPAHCVTPLTPNFEAAYAEAPPFMPTNQSVAENPQ